MILTSLAKPILIELATKVVPGSQGLEKLTREELITVVEDSGISKDELKGLITKLDITKQDTEQVTEQVKGVEKVSLPVSSERLNPKEVTKVEAEPVEQEVIVEGEYKVNLRLKRNGIIYEVGSILRERMSPPLVGLLKEGVIKPNMRKVK